MTKTYYSKNNNLSDSTRLSPAPQLSINTEPYYSGDIIIGYTYTISMRGYATAYRKTSSSVEPKFSAANIGLVTSSIHFIKNILSNNGSDLTITEDDGTTVFRAKGGTLRALSFNESPNNWMGYAEYTAEIEFNEIDLISGNSLGVIQCGSSYLDNLSKSSGVVDISKYKIKNFSDSWSFNIDDNIYNKVYSNLDTDNSRINVSYTISAIGKNFYVNGNLIPAWEQAKNFAQDRLYKQITSMLTTGLGLTGSTACSATAMLNTIGSSTSGSLSSLNGYAIYNETISCVTSESDGSFSATYNAILKRNNTSSINYAASLHTFNKTVSVQNDTRRTVTISIQGNIEGLVPGGIINGASGFRLPQNGAILISSSGSNKYNNALIALNLIMANNDLTQEMKNRFGISASSLGIINNSNGCSISNIKPASFNLTHNYHQGIISYNIDYNNIVACGAADGAFASVSIGVEAPVPVLAELLVPNGGVLIQDLNTFTASKVNINIEGKSVSNQNCCLDRDGLANYIVSVGNQGLPSSIVLPDMSGYILTQRQQTNNPLDGSYTISLSYICRQGCNI